MAQQQNPPRSHAVTRRLTEAWEFDTPQWERQLLYYDFERDEFLERSSKQVLTSEESFGHDVERFLSGRIETPLASYLTELEASGALAETLPWRQERALRLSLVYQGVRSKAAVGDVESLECLRRDAEKGDDFLDQLATAATRDWRFIGGQVPASRPPLYFPSAGMAMLPLGGGPPGFFQPTSPATFFACLPASVPEHVAHTAVQELMAAGMLTALSVGAICSKVVVPPELRTLDRSTLRTAIRGLREHSNEIARLISEANAVAGF